VTERISIDEAQVRFLELIEQVEAGLDFEFTRDGKVVARLIPARRHREVGGMFTGHARSLVPDEELFSTGERWNAQDPD
jgi:antitoxin (DNA-binding transcriptional repressor) of toxin-antitoxin stability system